MMNHKSSRQKT